MLEMLEGSMLEMLELLRGAAIGRDSKLWSRQASIPSVVARQACTKMSLKRRVFPMPRAPAQPGARHLGKTAAAQPAGRAAASWGNLSMISTVAAVGVARLSKRDRVEGERRVRLKQNRPHWNNATYRDLDVRAF
jgi:hypothetical protein